MTRNVSLFWRLFAVNAGLLSGLAVLLIVTPVTISARIKFEEVLVILVSLAVSLGANAFLLRRIVAPLAQLGRRMETVDLLRRGQRLEVRSDDEVGRVVGAFNRMLERLERERRQSSRRVLAAQEAERLGIARDLHDEVGQLLTAVLLQLNSAAEAESAHKTEIDDVRRTVRQALDEVRRISSELRPEMLEQLGLVSALTELATRFERVSGIRVDRQFDPELPRLSDDQELAVYRIAQESLTNVARHSEATRVWLALERHAGSLVLRVSDDGLGFDGSPQEHGGLRSMRERALLIDAALVVAPRRGGGVEVRLEVPAPPVVHAVGADG